MSVRTDRCASVAKEYARIARNYDRRWSTYVEATTRETMVRLSLPPTGQLLDVGCGTGVLLERLAASQPGIALSGVDPVPEMLSIARRRLPPSVELRSAWAEELPFQSETFDVVVSCNVLHYLTDPHEALREMARVVRPGGRVVVTDWCDDYLTCRICGLYLRFIRGVRYDLHGTRACASMLASAGLTVERIDRYKITMLWGLMTASAVRLAGGVNRLGH